MHLHKRNEYFSIFEASTCDTFLISMALEEMERMSTLRPNHQTDASPATMLHQRPFQFPGGRPERNVHNTTLTASVYHLS